MEPLLICNSHGWRCPDLLAILLTLVVLRLIKHLRFVPRWGPIMVAVVLTWQDIYVQLYLAVALGLTMGFAVSFHVAFGAELPAFSSIARSFASLFDMVRPWCSACRCLGRVPHAGAA